MTRGRHTIEEILCRLRHGFYPYYDRKNGVFYWDRESTRVVLELTPRVLAKTREMLAGIPESYRIAWNEDPAAVLDMLQDDQIREDTWVNDEVAEVYRLLLRSGLLLTVEAYDPAASLCGALLGIRLGGIVLAETMCRTKRNASKACLCSLLLRLESEGVPLVDVQVKHPPGHPVSHLFEVEMTLEAYLEQLGAATSALGALPEDPRYLASFPDSRGEWAEAHPTRLEKPRGRSLLICGFQMVQEWERPLLTAMGRAVARPGGSILEIGYGLGISAGAVQSASPALHVIVEANREIATAARRDHDDAVAAGSVVVLEGFWQDFVREGGRGWLQSGRFDGIIFDPYPLSVEELRRPDYGFFPWAERMLAPGGRFTYFSDESEDLSNEHRKRILECFPDADVLTERIPVQPWPDCEYWAAPRILLVVVQRRTGG